MSSSEYFYAYEKFNDALRSLAIGPDDVRHRLRPVFYHLRPLTEKHLPDHLQEDHRWILMQLTRLGPVKDKEGNVIRNALDNTLDRIRNSTGTKIAERIFHIYFELNSLYTDIEQQSK